MPFKLKAVLLYLAVTTPVYALHGPSGGRWRGGPDGDDDDDDDDDGFFGFGRGSPRSYSSRRSMLIAHGVLASLAFVILFPMGSILIRLGSFRYISLIHGIFQLFAYIVYTAAFGLGVWMVNDFPRNLLHRYHPIIGIVVFALLFVQPILGCIHHIKFKKLSRRTVWSYGHLWLGRILITLGIINGGLGLLLASDAPALPGFSPNRGQVIAYGVVAGIMWLLWVAAAIIGERRRSAASRQAKIVKDIVSDRDSINEHERRNLGTQPTYKEKGGQVYA